MLRPRPSAKVSARSGRAAPTNVVTIRGALRAGGRRTDVFPPGASGTGRRSSEGARCRVSIFTVATIYEPYVQNRSIRIDLGDHRMGLSFRRAASLRSSIPVISVLQR